MFQLQIRNGENSHQWLVVEISDSQAVLGEIRGADYPDLKPGDYQFFEIGKRRTQAEVLAAMNENAEHMARLTEAVTKTLRRMSLSADQPADEDTDLCRLHGQINSLRTEMQRMSDGFFLWHNAKLRRRKET